MMVSPAVGSVVVINRQGLGSFISPVVAVVLWRDRRTWLLLDPVVDCWPKMSLSFPHVGLVETPSPSRSSGPACPLLHSPCRRFRRFEPRLPHVARFTLDYRPGRDVVVGVIADRCSLHETETTFHGLE